MTRRASARSAPATAHSRSLDPGRPWSRSSLAEFAAAMRLPTEVGKVQLGEAVELRYRLPKLWARVTAGDLQAWRARRVARETIGLSMEAAGFVDAQVAPFAHRVGPAQVDRLVTEAMVRFMPNEAAARRRQAAEGRHVNVHTEHVSFDGTVCVEAELDLADGLDLDTALASRAAQLSALGSQDTLDVRRSLALGDLARNQFTLDLAAEPASSENADTENADTEGAVPADTARSARPVRKPRQVVLYVHLSDDAISTSPAGLHLARVENTRSFVDADQVRDWCGNPDVDLVIKPVIDLAEHIHVSAYEVPDRLAEQVTLVDLTCVFPWCTRPARRLRPDQHRADCDHAVEYDQGGSTCSCNIAPLCRRHHRLKTHTAWGYTVIERGTYLWTSPHGYQLLRDHEGTLDVSHDRRTKTAGHPPEPER